ncbi:MAG: TlpA family protein disulfide reductase [Chloroflexota bacterium]
MKPVVHGLESEYEEQVDFIYYNIDDPDTAEAKEEYGYRYQPHFFVVDSQGTVVAEWLGPVAEEEFVAAIESVIE